MVGSRVLDVNPPPFARGVARLSVLHHIGQFVASLLQVLGVLDLRRCRPSERTCDDAYEQPGTSPSQCVRGAPMPITKTCAFVGARRLMGFVSRRHPCARCASRAAAATLGPLANRTLLRNPPGTINCRPQVPTSAGLRRQPPQAADLHSSVMNLGADASWSPHPTLGCAGTFVAAVVAAAAPRPTCESAAIACRFVTGQNKAGRCGQHKSGGRTCSALC